MRISNQPGDAVLCLDGRVKVNHKIVGVWSRQYLIEVGKHFYFFSLGKDKDPVVTECYVHLFRAAISVYLSKHGIEGTRSESSKKQPAKISMEVEERRSRKSIGVRYGHLKRKLIKNEPLRGKSLDLALEIVDVHGDDEHSRLVKSMGEKMKAGVPLDEYERHIMFDILMLRF